MEEVEKLIKERLNLGMLPLSVRFEQEFLKTLEEGEFEKAKRVMKLIALIESGVEIEIEKTRDLELIKEWKDFIRSIKVDGDTIIISLPHTDIKVAFDIESMAKRLSVKQYNSKYVPTYNRLQRVFERKKIEKGLEKVFQLEKRIEKIEKILNLVIELLGCKKSEA